jgi:hypothetical protein
MKPLEPSLRLLSALVCVLAGVVAQAAPTSPENAFGARKKQSGALVGIFYDLKQTQQRQPVPGAAENYEKALDEFMVAGFDETLLNKYFRAALPLYSTQFSVQHMSAAAAPQAFGVDGVVKPSLWVVHYKGQISPPADGTYRFVGGADDVLIVAINRKVVLAGQLPTTKFPRLNWSEPADAGPRTAALNEARYGNWIDLKADKPVDIDLLVGERPGGVFYGVLLYEKRGEVYGKNGEGRAILPLFQVASQPANTNRYLTNRPPWKCWE